MSVVNINSLLIVLFEKKEIYIQNKIVTKELYHLKLDNLRYIEIKKNILVSYIFLYYASPGRDIHIKI